MLIIHFKFQGNAPNQLTANAPGKQQGQRSKRLNLVLWNGRAKQDTGQLVYLFTQLRFGV